MHWLRFVDAWNPRTQKQGQRLRPRKFNATSHGRQEDRPRYASVSVNYPAPRQETSTPLIHCKASKKQIACRPHHGRLTFTRCFIFDPWTPKGQKSGAKIQTYKLQRCSGTRTAGPTMSVSPSQEKNTQPTPCKTSKGPRKQEDAGPTAED
jgi:hypothetical protein